MGCGQGTAAGGNTLVTQELTAAVVPVPIDSGSYELKARTMAVEACAGLPVRRSQKASSPATALSSACMQMHARMQTDHTACVPQERMPLRMQLPTAAQYLQRDSSGTPSPTQLQCIQALVASGCRPPRQQTMHMLCAKSTSPPCPVMLLPAQKAGQLRAPSTPN